MFRFLVRKEVLWAFVAALALGWMSTAQPAAAQIKCFPSCSPTDGRFLVIASGTGLVTLSEETLDVQFAVPAGSTSFTLGIFDGDGGGVDLALRPHWDFGTAIPYSFTLYADPLADGTGSTVVPLAGLPAALSATMPDNDWIDYAIPTGPEALAPSGNYFYRLRIQLLNNLVASYNSFKLRTDGVVSIRLADQPFSYIAALRTVDERGIIYPAFPSLTPTTYDGVFRFFFDIAEPRTDLSVWDGDFDRGNADGTSPDTDDPDTPNAPFLPFWATADAVPEGVAAGLGASTGNPPDDLAATSVLRRPPAIHQDLFFPDGQSFLNDNPSGNQEWEQYLISTDPFDPTVMDATAPEIPAGVYELRIDGVDLGNLNALRLPSEALCVSETFEPCTPLRPFLVGDTVFLDSDGDGVQGPDEPGIPGVAVELVGTTGFVITITTTDADGNYTFPVEAGTYTVRVADSNSEPGGPLDGAIATTPVQLTESVVDDNVLTYDFGYRGTASIGDRVWLDRDGDGEQETGEGGINDVTVELLDGDGNVVASTTTAGDGDYLFDRLFPGAYSVRVVASTLPAGLEATYDLDGTGTADIAAVDLGSGEDRTDVDFGYRGNGSLGDRVWLDTDGDGVQGAGEAGLNGVTVRLLDGDGNVLATTVTGGDGGYAFDNLAAGTYTVEIDSATLPAGSVPTFDLDGTATAHRAVAILEAGDDRTDVDFGYRGSLSLGDRIWYDTDGDGAQDGGEPGLPGTTVELLNSGGTVIATTVTDGNGFYTFTNLAAGTYTVRVVASTLPAGGLSPTYDLDGTGTPHTAVVTLGGTSRTDVDFGYRGSRSLGDRVWNDVDGDGVQDATETGLNGVTVRLFLGTTLVATTVTAGNGNYTFTNLPDATFTVRIDTATLPAGMTQTYDLDGTASAHQATVTLSGSNRTDVDFGYRTPPVSCTAGYVKDHFSSASFSNNDGTLSWAGAWIESDTAGTGVSSGNVTVGSPYSGYLFLRDYPDTGTQPSAARQVNLAGFASATLSFSFHVRTGIDPEDAVVVEVSNNGGASYTVLETLNGFSGTDEETRSYNISSYIASNTRIRFRVTNGYGASDELFKLDWVKIEGTCTPAATGSIGNRVWNDADGDGTQDSGEAGLNGVTVQLLNSSGTVIATATTAGNGEYTFGNLPAGSYSVRVVSSTLPAGATPTYDLDGTSTAHIAAVTLAAGQNRTDADFGYRIQAVCTAGYFKDHFSSASFSRNDGTLSWAAAWVESDTAGTGVSSGNVTVGSPYSGYLFLRDSPDTGTQPSAARQANLAGAASAVLSFSFHVRTGVDPDDAVVVEVSNNGGSSYTVLETLKGFSGTYEGTRTYNISAYAASNTRIRFRVSAGYGASDELFKLDWVRIDTSCTPAEAPGTGTIGYWKTHPGDWPVAQITIGGRTYSRSQAIQWMGTSSRGDKTIDLFKQLVAAKLNVLVGNASSCIDGTIASADSWMASYPVGSRVGSSSSAWATAGPWHTKLDDYNNGELCAPHRD